MLQYVTIDLKTKGISVQWCRTSRKKRTGPIIGYKKDDLQKCDIKTQGSIETMCLFKRTAIFVSPTGLNEQASTQSTHIKVSENNYSEFHTTFTSKVRHWIQIWKDIVVQRHLLLIIQIHYSALKLCNNFFCDNFNSQ